MSVLEARIRAALALAGQKRLDGDLQGAHELALSILAIDEEHLEARRLLADLLAEIERRSEIERPSAPVATKAPPVAEALAAPEPPEAPAWPSMLESAASTPSPSVSLSPASRTAARHVAASPSSRRSSRSRMVSIAVGVGVLVGGAFLASAFLRSDPEAPHASPPSPSPDHTAVPAAVAPSQAPRDPATAGRVDPEVLRRAEASLARGDYLEAQATVNDGLRLAPSDPGLRSLQQRIQADARRAANEAAAGIREARSGAEKARAAELATRLFQQARSLESEAARSYERQLWNEAVAKGVEAVRTYREAQGQAEAEATRLQFEEARARAAEVEQARRAAAEAAAARPPATPAVSANPQDADRTAILAVIKSYTAAMQAKNLAALKALWPSLGGAQEAKVRSGFEFAKSVRVQIEVVGIQIANGAATVACQRTDTVVTREGQTVQSDRTAVIRLVRNNSGWSIAAIQ